MKCIVGNVLDALFGQIYLIPLCIPHWCTTSYANTWNTSTTHQHRSVSGLQQENSTPAPFRFFLLMLKPLDIMYAPNKRLKWLWLTSPHYRLSLINFYLKGFLLQRFQRYYHLVYSFLKHTLLKCIVFNYTYGTPTKSLTTHALHYFVTLTLTWSYMCPCQWYHTTESKPTIVYYLLRVSFRNERFANATCGWTNRAPRTYSGSAIQ